MNLSLKLEFDGLAGSDISDVVHDMCRISRQLEIMVISRFNGKTVIARPWDREDKILTAWEDSWKTKQTYIVGD